jgi:hypothetical protein
VKRGKNQVQTIRQYPGVVYCLIRLRLDTLQLVAGMRGKANRAKARQSEGGLGYGAIPL